MLNFKINTRDKKTTLLKSSLRKYSQSPDRNHLGYLVIDCQYYTVCTFQYWGQNLSLIYRNIVVVCITAQITTHVMYKDKENMIYFSLFLFQWYNNMEKEIINDAKKHVKRFVSARINAFLSTHICQVYLPLLTERMEIINSIAKNSLFLLSLL